MNKSEFLKKVGEGSGVSAAQAEKVVDAVIETVVGEINNGNEVIVPGFAKFSPRHRPSRPGRNPQTGASLQTKATNSVAFHPIKELRDKITQP